MLAYPNIDPVLLHLGPIEIRWYGLAYVAGIFGGIRLASPSLTRLGLGSDSIWDLPTYLIAGILLGGRIGYILIYDPSFYSSNWGHVFSIWEGGMSYHGGAIGALLGVIIFARNHRLSAWPLVDLLGWVSTIGIFLGRVANFINGELYGRTTSLPWGMVFPSGGPLPRHPSQLYEAAGEGIMLFLILTIVKMKWRIKPGQLFGLYLLGYGGVRFVIEMVREPDPQLGFICLGLSMGQCLCLAMIGIGSAVFLVRQRSSPLL